MNDMTPDAMRPVDPARRLAVTLSAYQWNVVRGLVGRGAHDDVAEILHDMVTQLRLGALTDPAPSGTPERQLRDPNTRGGAVVDLGHGITEPEQGHG